MKVLCCPTYVKQDISNKLDPNFNKYLFVMHSKETIGYCFNYPPEFKVFISRHATFLEKEFILKGGIGSKIDFE